MRHQANNISQWKPNQSEGSKRGKYDETLDENEADREGITNARRV